MLRSVDSREPVRHGAVDDHRATENGPGTRHGRGQTRTQPGPRLADQADEVVRLLAEELARRPQAQYPGRPRIALSRRTAEGAPGHPDCLAAVDDAARLCEQLGHEIVPAEFTTLTAQAGAAIGTVVMAAMAWIMRYWIRRLDRQPGSGDLEPGTRAYWEQGEKVSAAEYLLAVEDLHVFARSVARFLTGFDLWLTPTLSRPPARIGEIVSTPQEPLRALERGGQTIAYAVAGQLEVARPWAGRVPPVGERR